MRLVRLLLALSLCVGASCGSDASVSPSTTSFTGDYTLKTIDGQNLPFVITQFVGFSQAVASSRLTIADGGSWSETRVRLTTQNSQTTQDTVVNRGTWVRSGNLLNLQSTVSGVTAFTGSFTGTELDFTDFGYPYVFVR